MKVQLIENDNGEPTGVFIPINEWNQLKEQYMELSDLENSAPTKKQVLFEIKQALKELTELEKGNLTARPAQELLDEL